MRIDFRMVAALAVATSVLGCALGAAGSVPAEGLGRVPRSLTGSLSIARCERLVCEAPPDGDPRWTVMELGSSGLSSALPHREGVSWVRVRFTVDEASSLREPAILVTSPADAEVLSLNGTRIGGFGLVAERFVVAPAVPRLFTFPSALLRRGENELMMQALIAGRNVDAFNGPIMLGEQPALALESAKRRQPILATEAAFLSMFLFLLLFYGFLLSHGVLRTEYLLFTAFTATYAMVFILGSNLMQLGGFTSPWLQTAQEVLSSIMVLIMLSLVNSATGGGIGRTFIALSAIGAIFVLLDLVLPPLEALYWIEGSRKAYLGALAVYYLFLSSRAAMRRRQEAVPILLGVTIYAVGSRIELFWGIAMRDYVTGVFAVCMLYALTSRHARLQNRLVAISARLLDAHEEERRRIARDIHDTVGQSLLALRLRLQMLGSRAGKGDGPPPGAVDGLVQDTSAILEEVRRAAQDLRPSFLESMSLKDAIQWYVDQFSERHHLIVRVHVGSSTTLVDPPPRIKDNIYRIFQEILSNAIRHSQAARVDVSLYAEGKSIVLTVTDDGRGFDATAERGSGIGLSTMRERAELLGGTCRVESVPGRGTTIYVRVPLP